MEDRVLQTILDFVRLCLWLLILVMIFVPLERIFALHPQKIIRKAFFSDLLYYLLNNTLSKFLLIIPMALVGYTIRHYLPGAYYDRVAALPVVVKMFLGLLIGEFGFYWGHRWSHEIPFLWRFHAVHHSAEEMDWLVSTHSHPVDMVFTRLCGFVPLYFLGFSQPMATSLDFVSIFVIVTSVLWGFFIHANVKWRFGSLEWLVSTPAFHHWHHTLEKPHDKNYASMLPLYDFLFGTAHLPKKEWPAHYGCDTPVSPDLSAQLLDPIFPRPAQPVRQ